ncbi:hypothetical protein ACJMK2_003906 [Sinanodonta woodiana]|uniref:Uncharacterized protein n=1 Tax=Sinanodonta woodiana TaxID=1069815 RepID=A0ABD3XZL8_SINWO
MNFHILIISDILIMQSVIQAENCFETNDCNHLTCGNGNTIACVRPSDSDTHICTCTGASSSTCTTQADCRRDVCSSTRDPHEHCVDGHCRCLVRGR